MEDDDEFGDLYSDVLPTFTTSVKSQLGDADASKSYRNRPIDRGVAGDDDEIVYGAPQLKNSSSGLGLKLDASTQAQTLAGQELRPDRGGFDLNLDAWGTVGGNISRVEARVLEKGEGSRLPEKAAGELNFIDEDVNIVVEGLQQRDDEFVEKDVNFVGKREIVNSSADRNDNVIDYVVDAGNQSGPAFEDEWESDESEDDLQIVLNDNHMLVEEDGEEALVIVANDGDMNHGFQQTEIEEREGRTSGEGGYGADAERKELGVAAKTNGVGGIAAPTAVQPKIGYSSHMYHQPPHSQFKYVRPPAASTSGAASLTLGAGQVRPPITLGVVAGVKGAIPMQTEHQPGYGIPVWGAKAALRGYGSGLDFTLPSHKTIFEVDVDIFEEKPWRIPGMDVSDFFNFGLNEECWKDYCKKLEQLRLETRCVQGKIRVHEIGRAGQAYDLDLPPELAAAVGIRGIPSENANPGNAHAGATDLARGSGRPPAPIGRPIPVETGAGDRIPSIDTRRLRLHDSDTVIEIVCQNSAEDDNREEHQDNDSAEEVEVHDLKQDDVGHIHHSSHAYNGQKTKLTASMEQLKNTVNRDEIVREASLHVVTEAAGENQPDISADEESYYMSGKGRANSGENGHVINDQNESSSLLIVSDGEQAAAVVDDNDVSLTDDRSLDTEREDTTRGATTKHGGISHVEQVSQEYDDKEDSKSSRSSESKKARTRSNKDERKSHETLKDEGHQDIHYPLLGNSQRSVGDEDGAHIRHRGDEIQNNIMAVKERENPRRGGGFNSSLHMHMHMKSESTDRKKENGTSDRSWRHRDEDFHRRRTRVEDSRKRERGGEFGSINRDKARERQSGDQKPGSRQRNWHDDLQLQNEKVDDILNKRRKDGAHINLDHAEKEVRYDQREGSTRRKRERDNSSDQRRTDCYAKAKYDCLHTAGQKREESLQRERGDRQRDHDERHMHEESLTRRPREENKSVMRSGRPFEDKTWSIHTQKNDDYGRSRKEYHPRSVDRHGEQSRRMNMIESESFPQDKVHANAYERGNQGINEVMRARNERVDRNDKHVVHTSHTLRLYEHRQNKESEIGDHGSFVSCKKNKDEHIIQISDKVNLRSKTKQESGEDDIHVKQSSGKHGEGTSADDFHDGTRRGRSKSKNQTSHKEKDGITPIPSSSLNKSKDPTKNSEEPLDKLEENRQPSIDNREDSSEVNNSKKEDKHLDTVRLKKRSERFKLAMPQKEVVAMKSESLPSSETENRPNSANKAERPARKRRWRGN